MVQKNTIRMTPYKGNRNQEARHYVKEKREGMQQMRPNVITEKQKDQKDAEIRNKTRQIPTVLFFLQCF